MRLPIIRRSTVDVTIIFVQKNTSNNNKVDLLTSIFECVNRLFCVF